MEDERDSGDVPRTVLSDTTGPRSGFKLSAKLMARMEKLEKWRIRPSSITFPEEPREFSRGHAIVSKAFLTDNIGRNYWWNKYYNSREVMQLCRQSLESDDHIRGAADHRRDAEGELGDEEKDDEEEHGSDIDALRWGEFVAVKKSRTGDNTDQEQLLGLALREIEFIVELSHPNIVKLRGFVEDLSKGMIWLVFPWEENGNLEDFVASQDWKIPERTSLIYNVASGLEYLHSQKPPICYGDLNSYHVLVNSKHVAVLTRFGSARRITEKTSTHMKNVDSLRWAAPELLIDGRTSLWGDIWALGWIAYLVLTNCIPFQDVYSNAIIVERVVKGDLPIPSEHYRVSSSEELSSLMTMCWNSSPGERPTAKDYLRAVGDMPMTIPAFSRRSSSINPVDRGEVQLRGLVSDSWMPDPVESVDDSIFLRKFPFIPSRAPSHSGYTSERPEERSAGLLLELGRIYGLRADIVPAGSHYQSALDIATVSGNVTVQADALIGLGGIYNIQSRWLDAEKALMEAHEIHSRMGNILGVANALIGLGEIDVRRSRHPEAEKTFTEAHEIHSRMGNILGVANALIGLGEIDVRRSRYPEAEKAFTEAHEIHSRMGTTLGVANALIGLGEVSSAHSRYSEAEKSFKDAHKVHSHFGNYLGVANVLMGLGQVYGDQSRYPEAETAFLEAYDIYLDIGIGHGISAANALVCLGEIHDAQSNWIEAEATLNRLGDIASWIGDDLTVAKGLNDLRENSHARSEDSGGEECSKETASPHFRVETCIEASDALCNSGEIEFGAQAVDFKDKEPCKEAPEIHSSIHNDSRSVSAVENPHQANFIQEFASIKSISMPSTQYIVDLILALAKTAPTAIRNKHQLYRILIITRDVCYHLHRVAHTGGDSSNGPNVLEQGWEIMDSLERTLLELNDIFSQETVPFGALSLATWNNSRTGLGRMYEKLTGPPFNTYDVDGSANATWDRYFDDCSWMSLLLLEGIELPVQNMHPEAEEGFSTEAQNVIDRLNHLVNETKLNGNTDEPTRELFIRILSDVGNLIINRTDNLSADLWNAVDGALQDIDVEKGLNQDLVDSLRDSWSGLADRPIQQASTSRSPVPALTQGPIAVSLPQELTLLDHEITPASEPLVLLLQSLGRGALTATRNKHKIYAIVSRARDICNDILAIGVRPEVGGLEALDEYYNLVDTLEGILLDVARLLPTEQVSFGREMCASWSESREEFRKILNRLHEPPFRPDLSALNQELTNNSVFDDHYWLSLLLEAGIERELDQQYTDTEMPPAVISVREGLRYLENEIKCGHHEEATRELVIDIATRVYETLSASVSEKESDTTLPIRSAEPSPPITLDRVTLVTALSIAFSVFDPESSLESEDIRILADNWRGISHSVPTRRPRSLGETTLAGSSSPAGPEGHGDNETPQGSADRGICRRELHNFARRENLGLSISAMVFRDNKNWIVTIQITGEGRDTLSLTGMGLLKSEAYEAASRLALIVLGKM